MSDKTEQVNAIPQYKPDFSREQTETLKHLACIDEFYPSMWETKQAGAIFTKRLKELLEDVSNNEISKDGAITMAAAAVWRAARRYQADYGSGSLSRR